MAAHTDQGRDADLGEVGPQVDVADAGLPAGPPRRRLPPVARLDSDRRSRVAVGEGGVQSCWSRLSRPRLARPATQTETLVVRGLSIGVGTGQVAVRELLTGLLVGATLAAAFVPVGLWRWEERDVVVALPWLLHRLGRDPAYGSGPLATVVQDLLSVLIYMVIAGSLVR